MTTHGNRLFMVLLGFWIALILSGCTMNDAKSRNLEQETSDVRADARSPIGVAEIAQNPTTYRGQRLRIRGFLVIEPENTNLWERGETYGSNEGACASVEVTDVLFNRREALSRREVVLSSVINVPEEASGSADSCGDILLSDVAIVSFVTPLDRLSVVPSNAEQGWFDVNEDAPDMDRLRDLAAKLSNAIGGSNDDNRAADIARLVPPRHAAQVSKALKREGSRIRWLVYDWSESFSTLMSLGRFTVVDVAQEPRDSASAGRQAALCFCAGASCDPRTLSPQRVYFRGAADPYHCVPVLREKQEWFLDAGYLLGRPDEETMD
jgi:hypothetical protein